MSTLFLAVSCFRRALAVCLPACVCVGLCAAFACAASPVAPQKARHASSQRAVASGWDFQAPDRSAQHARWHESISATLQQTTFAPSAPAGRYLRHGAASSGKRLPPARVEDLNAMLPPEKSQRTGGTGTVRGEFTRERTSWRPQHDAADTFGATPVIREERRAGAYAGFQPGEDMEIRLGPEYYLGSSVHLPEQAGHARESSAGALGMGMKLQIGF